MQDGLWKLCPQRSQHRQRLTVTQAMEVATAANFLLFKTVTAMTQQMFHLSMKLQTKINKLLLLCKPIPTSQLVTCESKTTSQTLKKALFFKTKIRNHMEQFLQARRIFTRLIKGSSSSDSKARNTREDTEGEIRALDPAMKHKLVAPLDPTDQHSNDKLECNVGKLQSHSSLGNAVGLSLWLQELAATHSMQRFESFCSIVNPFLKCKPFLSVHEPICMEEKNHEPIF